MTANRKDILIIIGCILSNVILVILIYPHFAVIGTDGVSYALMAKSIAQGHGLTVFGHPHLFYSPLTSFLIVPFYWFIGNIELASHVALIVISLLTLPLLYYAVRPVIGRSTALLAAFFLSINALWFWTNSLGVAAQPLAGFLSVLLLFFLIKFAQLDDLTKRNLLVYGIIFGCISAAAYLTRPEYLFSIIPLIIFVWFIHKEKISLRQRWTMIITLLVTFLLAIVPYILFLHAHSGYWTFSGRLQSLFSGSMNLPSDVGIINPGAIGGAQILLFLKNWQPLVKFYFKNLYSIEHILLRAFGIVGFSFFAFGLRKFILTKKYRELSAIAVPLSYPFILAIGHPGTDGYITPILYAFIIFIGVGCLQFSKELSDSLRLSHIKKNLLCSALIIVSACYFVFPNFQGYFFLPKDYTQVEYRMLGQWFRDNIPDPAHKIIVARKPEIPFYAGTNWQEITGRETLGDILYMMRKNGLIYLVIDQSLQNTAPYLLEAAQNKKIPGGLLLSQFEYAGHTAYLYQIGK